MENDLLHYVRERCRSCWIARAAPFCFGAEMGMSFMENDYRWHGRAPSREEVAKALAESDAFEAVPPAAVPSVRPPKKENL